MFGHENGRRWFRLIKDVVFFFLGLLSPNCCYLRLCVLANLPVHALVFGCLGVEDLKVFQSFLWGFWRFWATRLPGFFFLVSPKASTPSSPPESPSEGGNHVTTRFFLEGPLKIVVQYGSVFVLFSNWCEPCPEDFPPILAIKDFEDMIRLD